MDMYQKREMRKNKKMNENTKSLPSTSINWFPGHMAKAKREIKEKIDLIDIVFEVIDARIPKSSKNNDIEDIIKNKPRILIMTKSDLCDKNITLEWKKYYESKGYRVVLLDLLHDNVNEIFSIVNELMESINSKRISKGLKPRRVRSLVLGIPNVGKSTLINRLVGKKAVNVGNKPGITKNLEWIRINDKLELLDTPGILWPKFNDSTIAYNLASMTAIKEEILDIEDISIYIIKTMFKLYPDNIISRYGVNDDEDIVNILDGIGKKIGAVRNGEVDYDRVYIKVLRDLRDGYLGKITFDRF